jgi:hypothetical protein
VSNKGKNMLRLAMGTDLATSTDYIWKVLTVCPSLSSVYTANQRFTTVSAAKEGMVSNEAISIFPSPTTGRFTLSGVSHDALVVVFSVQGQQVLNLKGNTVDLSNQSKGVYLIKVISEGNVWNGKVVKE